MQDINIILLIDCHIKNQKKTPEMKYGYSYFIKFKIIIDMTLLIFLILFLFNNLQLIK